MELELQALRSSLDVEKQATDLSVGIIDAAESLVVDSDQSFEYAAQLEKELKAKRKRIQAFFKPSKDMWIEGHKKEVARERKYLDVYDKAIPIVTTKAVQYYREQEAIRRKEQARLEAEARAREEAQRLAEAEQLEKVGDHEAAEAVISEPINVPIPSTKRATPKVTGHSMTTTWKGKVINLRKLVDGIAAGEVPVAAVEANLTFINQNARQMEKNLDWPGVETYPEYGTRSR